MAGNHLASSPDLEAAKDEVLHMMARYNKAKEAALARRGCSSNEYSHAFLTSYTTGRAGALAPEDAHRSSSAGVLRRTANDTELRQENLFFVNPNTNSTSALDRVLGPQTAFAAFHGKSSREKPRVLTSTVPRDPPTKIQPKDMSAHQKGTRAYFADWPGLLAKLPTGLGPATTTRRNQIWRAMAGTGGGTLSSIEVVHGLRAVLHLEDGFPQGIGPLLNRAMQVAYNAARPYSSVPAGIERGETFRLVLVGLRAYIELFAIISYRMPCGALQPSDLDGVSIDPTKPIVPVAVTREQYMWLQPMLRHWGVAPLDAAAEFSSLDPSNSGVIKFNDFARTVLPATLRSAALEGTGRPQAFLCAGPAGNEADEGGKKWNDDARMQATAPRRSPSPQAHRHDVHAASSPCPTARRQEVVGAKGGVVRPTSARRPFVVSSGGVGGSDRLAQGASFTVRKKPGLQQSILQRHMSDAYNPSLVLDKMPPSRHFDLADRLAAVGLSQYSRKLQEMGFDDVEQFLTLELTIDERDGLRVHERSLDFVLDRIAPAPGHRTRLMNFFHNETRRAQRGMREKIKDLRSSHTKQLAKANAEMEEEYRRVLARAERLESDARRARAAAEEAQRSSKEAEESARAIHDSILGKKEAAHRDRIQPQVVRGILSSVFNNLLKPIVHAWRHEVVTSRTEETRIRRFIGRILNASRARAFNLWAQHGAVRTRMRKAMRRLGPNRRLAGAWNQWMATSHASAARRTRLERLARRVKHGSVGKAWTSWFALWEAKAIILRAMNKVFVMWRHRKLRRSVGTWVGQTEDKKQKRQQCTRSLQRIRLRGASRALTAWQGRCASARHEKAALMRFTSRDLCKGFDHWKSLGAASGDLAKKRARVAKFVQRSLSQKLARAITQWLEVYMATVDAKRRMRAVVSRLILREVTRCWMEWKHTASELSAQRNKLRKAFANVAMKEVARAWRQWVDEALALMRLRSTLMGIQMKREKLALREWLAYSERESAKARMGQHKGWPIWRLLRYLIQMERNYVHKLGTNHSKRRVRQKTRKTLESTSRRSKKVAPAPEYHQDAHSVFQEPTPHAASGVWAADYHSNSRVLSHNRHCAHQESRPGAPQGARRIPGPLPSLDSGKDSSHRAGAAHGRSPEGTAARCSRNVSFARMPVALSVTD
mmetsp:Transcript_47483/g.117558  ORF Transcript_47483/g.117558 Transcript_47483/m.117558 type:complete len:1167 (-) Transcript_47483:221-3721(-)